MVDGKGSFPFRKSGFMMSMSMERGINSSSYSTSSGGFSVSDKAAASAKESKNVVGLGLKLQSTESFPYNKMMMMVPDSHNHHHRPFSSPSSQSSAAAGGGGDGPTCNKAVSDIYDVAGSAGNGFGGAVVRTLQPFDISSATTPTALKSPGGMAAASMGFWPFTHAQWKELERQAMIYKYMMASVPVPPDLLLPITRNHCDPAASHSTLGRGSVFNLRFSNNTDPEPGRCRRTDGKKWRCSRDVAPDQKYCERHMHRGRPRSRKPVEVHAPDFNNTNKKKTTTRLHNVLPVTPTVSSPMVDGNASSTHYLGSSTAQPYQMTPAFPDKFDNKACPFESVATVSSYKEPRGLEWMMKRETVPMATSDQEWNHLMQTKIGLTPAESTFCNTYASVFPQHCKEEPLNLNSYTEDCALFFNPDMVSLEKPHTETPRDFIDAWSNAVTEDNNVHTGDKNSVSSDGKLSLSSLALSMASHNSINEEVGQIQMGLGVINSDHNHGGGDNKPQFSSWLTQSSWVAPTPGGPLAEVLRPSTIAAAAAATATGSASNPASPIAGNGDSVSPQATTVSSPSGVLQKALVSMSDSSGNSSPTLVASSVKPEIGFQWLNQSKS
ncbi:hypothetical protein L1049_020681 [Liquidambar formosana]|uniref:Growth-regulating factor n=1 Tax=Liquidambar formosana TaxID=63359 RepID=A0AAP0X7M0_LIQFO